MNIRKFFQNSLPALFGVALLGGCSPYVYRAEFRERADTITPGDLLGPFTGRVTDGGSGKPLAKAIVYGSWEVVRGVGFAVPAGRATFIARTNADGRYRVPRLPRLPSGMTRAVARFRLVVYKRGYVAYRSDRVFPGDERRFDFVQLQNVVKLERWSDELSHLDHVRFIGGHGVLRKATAWEVHAAVAQLEGRTVAGDGGTTGGSTRKLNASDLLDEDDVEDLTGYGDDFEVSRLNDMPRTPRYDSKHFKAESKDQQYDLAYRVWLLGTRRAEKHYGKLLAAYPNAKPHDELGDRSFRSHAPKITATVWLTRKPGVVISLTCGRKLCKTPTVLLKVARLIHDRLGRLRHGDAARTVPPMNPNPFRPVRPRVPQLK